MRLRVSSSVWLRATATWVVGAAALMAMSGAWAGGVLAAAEARQWLTRMHDAATQRNYQGTLVVTAEGAMSSSRVVHFCEAGHSYERVDMLDGQPRRILRHDDQLLTLWPRLRTARLEQRESAQPFPSLLTGGEDQLFERYEMVGEGAGRVAGFDAAVFLLRPRDDSRFAQRLWAERGSGLLLRADVVGADGRVLESSAFTDLSIGGKVRPESMSTVLKQISGWRVLKPATQRTSLEAHGWRLKVPVPGFRESNCVKRQLDPAPQETTSAAGDVLQAIFTDGLTHVSLFIEPVHPERQRSGGAASGATHTWMQAHGDYWITAVGDVPLVTLKKFVAALERSSR
jgi:sigma-E factor negative regulatory protein RseB